MNRLRSTTVSDVMTSPAITVTPTTGFREIVRVLEEHQISAVPVVDIDGQLVGIVSEADLLLKEADWRPDGKLHLLEGRQRRRQRAKALGQAAADLMTSPVVTIEPDGSLAAAARLMHHKRVKRLPVVNADGPLLGIVSRGDILNVYLRGDAEIKREVVEDLMLRTLWMDPRPVEVSVHDGVVTLSGEVDRHSDIPILTRMVAAIEGVVGVKEDLGFRYDDTHAGSFSLCWMRPARDGRRAR